MPRFRRILHATDFSPASNRALGTALALAKQHRAALLIAHVRPPIVPIGEGYIPPATYATLDAADRRTAQAKLARLVARAKTAKVRARGLLLDGIPHEQISRSARRADLVVMGTHGRTGLPRFVLGSVAGRVLTLASCPVLTVRGRPRPKAR
jgi:nucleotide-binding universal stress UspA family protein